EAGEIVPLYRLTLTARLGIRSRSAVMTNVVSCRGRCLHHRGFAMPIFPVSPLDPFADNFLAAPYPFYAELRDAGPVVWLERYGLWTCARHAEVQAALSAWQRVSSTAGVGTDDFPAAQP